MANTDLAVRIATILDASGLKKADKAFKGLDKSAKNLGRTLGVSLGSAAIVAFGKRAVTAFAADEKAATQLNLALKNLGLGFAEATSTKFIADLERTAAIADDQLRPAFQTLLTTTGSLTESQKLLNLAIQTSRGSGVDLATTAKDIANAYVGNTRGLRKYYLGLTQAELKTASFAQVQEKLNEQFSGANAAYLDTTAGKMEAIGVAAGNASEVIGGALVDAFITASGANGALGLADSITKIGDKIANLIEDAAKLAFSIKAIFNPKYWKSGGGAQIWEDFDKMMSARNYAAARPFSAQNNAVTGYKVDTAAARKAEQDAAKRAKAIVDAQKKNTAELKKQSLTKKQSALFDLEQIQIIAALKGKISEEDKLRLKLQLALLTENESEAAKLSKQLAMSIDSTGKLAEYLTTLPDAKNPFKGWDEWLKSFKSELGGINMLGLASDSARGNIPPTNVAPVTDPNAVTGFAPGGVITAGGQVIKVDLNVDGKTLASVLQDASLSGNQVYVDRLTGRFYQ